jgi:hypothetical protein
MKRCIILFLLIFIIPEMLSAQDITQIIRVKVIDKDSKKPLASVSIAIAGSNPQIVTISDLDGSIKFERLPVGRNTIQVYYLGYEPATVPNVLIGAGKEAVLTIEMRESVVNLNEIIVKSKNQGEVINKMAVVIAGMLTNKINKTARHIFSSCIIFKNVLQQLISTSVIFFQFIKVYCVTYQ